MISNHTDFITHSENLDSDDSVQSLDELVNNTGSHNNGLIIIPDTGNFSTIAALSTIIKTRLLQSPTPLLLAFESS